MQSERNENHITELTKTEKYQVIFDCRTLKMSLVLRNQEALQEFIVTN